MRCAQRRVFWIVLLVCSAVLVSTARARITNSVYPQRGTVDLNQSQGCSPMMAGLLPSGAAHVTCNYTKSGDMGSGGGSADLPYDSPCPSAKSNKFPAHLNFDVKHYGGQATKLFLMQIDSEERERFESQRAQLMKKGRPRDVQITTEAVPGGTLAYFGYSRTCNAVTGDLEYRASLVGVGHSGTTAMNLTIEGSMPATAARSAAMEILQRFGKANFD